VVIFFLKGVIFVSNINKMKLEQSFKDILNNEDSLTNNCDLPKAVEESDNKLFKEIYCDFQLKLEKITKAIIESID